MKIHIISTGRCGTTLLSRISEELQLELEHQVKGSRILNILANMQFLGLLPSKIVLRYYRRFSDDNGVPRSTSDPLRSMAFSLWIREQVDNPDIKVLHVVREKSEFINSFMRWKQSSSRRYVLHHFIPFWTPVLRIQMLPRPMRWLTKREHYSKVWEIKNSVFSSVQYVRGIEYFTISFDDLVVGEKQSVELLASLFNVEAEVISDIINSLGKINNS